MDSFYQKKPYRNAQRQQLFLERLGSSVNVSFCRTGGGRVLQEKPYHKGLNESK